MAKPQTMIEQVRSKVSVERERLRPPSLHADRKAAKRARHKAKVYNQDLSILQAEPAGHKYLPFLLCLTMVL